MAYFNDTNGARFYPTSTSCEFDTYPGQTSASEQANNQTFGTFANGWSVGSQQDYLVDSLTGLSTEASFEPVSSVQDHGYDLLSYQEHYWPVTVQYAWSYPSGIMGQYNSFVRGMAAFEAPTATPAPTGNIPLNYWGESESGPFTGTFYAVKCANSISMAGMMQTQRYQPYETPRAFSSEYTNGEARPSNLAPSFVPYTAPPTTYPSGGRPQATADTETDKEHAAPLSERSASGNQEALRLRATTQVAHLVPARSRAKGWEGLAKPPTYKKALGTVLEVVELTLIPVYTAPRLKKGAGTRTTQGKGPDVEYGKGEGTQELNEELSRYYRLGVSQSTWECPGLLTKALDHAENLLNPPAVPPA